MTLVAILVFDAAFGQASVGGRRNVKSELKIEKLLIFVVNDPTTIDFFQSFATSLKESLERKHIEVEIYLPTSYDSLQFRERLNNEPNAIIFISGKRAIYNLNTGKERIVHQMTLVHRKEPDIYQNVWIGSLRLILNDRMQQYSKDSAIKLLKLWEKARYVDE